MFNFLKKSQKEKDTDAVEKFRDDDNPLISFQQLSEIPLNEVQQLYPENPGSVEFLRIENNCEDLSFRVTMQTGTFWKHHYHDSIETIVVYKGRVHDNVSGKSAKRGGLMSFKEYKTHYITAEEESIFYVEFKKPKV